MHVLLTGATGTLGSKILFSLLEMEFDVITKIYLPIRAKKWASAEQRLERMIFSDFAPKFIKEHRTEILQKLQVVAMSAFLRPNTFLADEKIDYFIHGAGYVNLSTDKAMKHEIFKENLEFTKRIFNAFYLKVKKFTYVSTAFAAGDQGGMLDEDYSKIRCYNHRNAYEASKRACERFLLAAGNEKKVPIQILRPSVLGGNINDTPHFFISKYMVFYLFAKFFKNCNTKDVIRISTKAGAGLNIIPTDYAAKVIVKAMKKNIPQLNIVNAKETNLIQGMAKIFEIVGFSNFSFTQEAINEKTGYASELERIYYQTIGVHLTPYLNSKPNVWNTRLLESVLPLPDYDLEEYLSQTVSFAVAQNFRNQKW